jgi:hypothetical protein
VTILIALSESQWSGSGIVSGLSSFYGEERVKSAANLANVMPSLIAVLIAQYSAIVDDVATISCLWEDHAIGAPAKN